MGYSKSPTLALNSGIGDISFNCYYDVWLGQLNVKAAEPLLFFKNKGAFNSAKWGI